MIYNAGFIIVISFSPAFLMELGRSIGEAGFVSSLIMWVMVAAIPLGGLLADRLGATRLLIIVGCLGTALGVGYLTQSAAPLWLVVAIGMMMGLPAGPIMTLPGEVLAPERRGVGLGIYFTWYYVGMAVFPPVAGAIQDATGGAGTSLLFAAALMAFTILMLGLFQAVKAGGLSLPGMKLPRRPGGAAKAAQPPTPPAASPRETAVFTTVRNIPPMPDA
jgi:MFS family permease